MIFIFICTFYFLDCIPFQKILDVECIQCPHSKLSDEVFLQPCQRRGIWRVVHWESVHLWKKSTLCHISPCPFQIDHIFQFCLLYLSNQNGSFSFCIIPRYTAVLNSESGTMLITLGISEMWMKAHSSHTVLRQNKLWRSIILIWLKTQSKLDQVTVGNHLELHLPFPGCQATEFCQYLLFHTFTLSLSLAARPLIFYSICFSNLTLQLPLRETDSLLFQAVSWFSPSSLSQSSP